jgi:hypothetical protein
MSKTRNYLIAGTALLALSGTAVAEPRPDGPTRNIDCPLVGCFRHQITPGADLELK